MLILLHLGTLFLLVLLGFYVFVADPRSRAHQTFAAFISFFALWTTKDLIFWNFSISENAADWWIASSFIIALLMQFVLVVFAWVFPENGRTPKRKAAILFSPGAVLIPAALLGYLWRSSTFNNGVFDIQLTHTAFVYVIYVFFLFSYGTFTLNKKYRVYLGTQKGKQVGAIILALLITGVLMPTATIILPFIKVYALLPYSSLFILPGVLIYAFAISRFRLFSLQTALDQFRLFPIAYKVALSIACVAIASFLLLQVPIAWWAFQGSPADESWKRYLVFSVITALIPNLILLMLIVRTISRPLRRLTLVALDVAEGSYGTIVDLRKSNDEIGLLADSFNEMSQKMADDIVKLKNFNEEIQQADRLNAMGSLASGIAHEINEPIDQISKFIRKIRSNELSQSEIDKSLSAILDKTEMISRLTQDLADFAKVRPAAKKHINLVETINSSIRLATYDESFQNIDLVLNVDAELPEIFADQGQIQQVFLNLLFNARDRLASTPSVQNTYIKIDAYQKGSNAQVKFTDSGDKFGDEILSKTFDPFATSINADNKGLGLAVCYGIISKHNGTIEVSENNDGDTTFTITLPLKQ